MTLAEMKDVTRALMPRLRAELEALVRLPSIAFPGFPEEPVMADRRGGRAAPSRRRPAGRAPAGRAGRAPGGVRAAAGAAGRAHRPAVRALRRAAGGRRVAVDESTLRAHRARRSPVRPRRRRRQERHPRARRRALALGADCPVGVKVLVEGSEESGGGGIEEFVHENAELLAADAIVIKRRRQLRPRCADADYIPARHGGLRRRGRDVGGRRAQRHVRRPGARRARRAHAHDRDAARRRGQRRRRGTCDDGVSRRRGLPRGRLPRRRAASCPASTSSATGASPSGCTPGRRST